MKELFSIGPLHVYFFGLMVALGIIGAVSFADWQAKKRGINDDIMFNLSVIGVIAGIVGARLFYILFYDPSFYFSHPINIFKITEGGLSIHGYDSYIFKEYFFNPSHNCFSYSFLQDSGVNL
ncbi:prolipoprotein diacylglyceryl transferase [Clostridium sp.]